MHHTWKLKSYREIETAIEIDWQPLMHYIPEEPTLEEWHNLDPQTSLIPTQVLPTQDSDQLTGEYLLRA